MPTDGPDPVDPSFEVAPRPVHVNSARSHRATIPRQPRTAFEHAVERPDLGGYARDRAHTEPVAVTQNSTSWVHGSDPATRGRYLLDKWLPLTCRALPLEDYSWSTRAATTSKQL